MKIRKSRKIPGHICYPWIVWMSVLWQPILDGRGLTWQNVNGAETREVRCRRKKGKAIIAVECGARAARHRRTSSASSFRPPWLKVDIERRGVAPGTALAIFDPATYRAGDRPRQKLAVLIAWMCRTICKCAEYEPFLYYSQLAPRFYSSCPIN